MMKRLFYYLLLGIITACSLSSNYRQQLAEVEACIEDHPDSAKVLLEKIPSSLLGEEDKALYYLLLTMANYKLYQSFTDDSLVSFSVSYYESNSNYPRLATSYYYCGAINYEEFGKKDIASNYSAIIPFCP